uniref:Pre-mRNA-splicing factor SYF2 n=1 Tax=Panagrellus redivivus TaxID=6233 RepID=A0A7E4ZXG9_PANRE
MSFNRNRSRAEASIREKLTTAANDLRDPKYTTKSGEVDHHRLQTLNLSHSEQTRRKDIINAIASDTGGFTPGTFVSSRSARNQNAKKSGQLSGNVSGLTDHEKAMFGAQWQSKALAREKNLNVEEKTEESKDETPDVYEVPTEADTLAHERFSEDPKVRQERWLNLFRERRRNLLAGDA